MNSRFKVLDRDGFRCRYCGKGAPEVVLHVDHVHPRSKGGSDDLENLVTACRDCNLSKGALTLSSPVPVSGSPLRREGLVGLFFLTVGDGRRGWQGHVEAMLPDGAVLVQLYSWFMGEPNGSRLIPLTKIIDEEWTFYKHAEEWREAGGRWLDFDRARRQTLCAGGGIVKVKMKSTMRTLTRKGIVLLAKKTKDAAKAYEKAFLSPLTAQVAAEAGQ